MADSQRTGSSSLDGFGPASDNDNLCHENTEIADFSDRQCQQSASEFNSYLSTNPDPDIISVSYDAQGKVFLVIHRLDRKFSVTPERFFALVNENVISSIMGKAKKLAGDAMEKSKAA